ncbi:16059_t:CDS:2 [Funneliformis caledonium]|uniref:16059_t:CDS:1 n=1 Tax=Funneliformis caledonium TaxID=1117310 RepID=A0A9N9HB35_9GLOM|nr:16059_t:CDS:2 [Funneliformis caledonium]
MSNKEITGVISKHVSDMCEEMKVLFLRSQNPSSAVIIAIAKNPAT